MQIILFERIGKRCVSLEDGLNIYPDLLSSLKKKEIAHINFKSVEKVYTPFLNGAFGGLFKYYDKEYILGHLSFFKISAEHLEKINEFIDDIDLQDTDRKFRETLKEFYDEDSLSDL